MALATGDVILWNDIQDGSGSTTNDSGSNNYDGTITNATWTTGSGITNLDKYLAFDGTNDKVAWARVTQTENVSILTIAAWVYFTDTNDRMLWATDDIGSGNAIQCYWENNPTPDEIYFAVQNVNKRAVLTTTTFATGTWYHIALVFEGGASDNSNRLKVYVNGAATTPTYVGTIEATTQTSTNPFVFGERPGGTFDFNGRLTQMVILNKAATSAEISDLYNAGAGKTYAQVFAPASNKSAILAFF